MPGYIYIPQAVKESISEHVKTSIPRAIAGFESSSENEDSMTGYLGGVLSIGNQYVDVKDGEIRGRWSWSIKYKKFRSGGPSATENIIGADGVFEVFVNNGFAIDKKSLLFQAKIGLEGDARLNSQCVKMSTWREAAFVLSYNEDGFFAFLIDDVLKAKGDMRLIQNKQNLATILGRNFIECKIGHTNLDYDAQKKFLVWETMDNEVVAVKFNTKHRISIDVKAPVRRRYLKDIHRVVDSGEVHKHRLKVDPRELLYFDYNGDSLKAARNSVIKTFHPDKHMKLSAEDMIIINFRAKEVMNAFDELRKK